MRKVAVTGLGLVSPMGLDAPSAWTNLQRGHSGIRTIPDPEGAYDVISSRIAGCVWDFDPLSHFSKKELKRYDPFVQYAMVAAQEAMVSASLTDHDDSLDLNRCGVVIGSGIGGLSCIQNETKKFYLQSPDRLSPFFIPASLINMVSGFVSLKTGFKGPNLSLVSACASGSHSIMYAAQQIETGLCDVMICGGTEHGSNLLGMSGFAALRALSTRNEEPQLASRPWDKDRDGFVMSDGAGVVVLEDLDHARRRGANIYAIVSGYGMSADAHHMTQPSDDGDGAVRCMQAALDKAQMSPDEIGYINAHATSTPVGDQVEPLAIKKVFSDHAYQLCVSSTKSMHGHMLGAAGAAEAVISIMSLHNQAVPATINLDTPSEGCDLDFVPHTMRDLSYNSVMSNSFGFGGTNATLIFSRP
tara:strand:- start:13 stop:1257 length:1245 start_codon:yes stop_codon:yes gene_type:complete